MSSRRTTTTTTTTARKSSTGSTKKAAPPPPPKPGAGPRRGSKKEEEVPRRDPVRKTSSSSSSGSSASASFGVSSAAAASSPRTPPPVSPREKTLFHRDEPPLDAAAGVDEDRSPPPEEESDIDREVRRHMEEDAEESKKIKQEIRDRVQAAMDSRQSDMAASFEKSYNNSIRGMDERYSGQLKGQIDTKQTDVLRTNKVFREIGRGLGAEWPFIFRTLMKDFSPTVTENEIDRITTTYRPYMQPYNALLEWKRQMAEDFYIQPLIDALRSSREYDLAEKAMDIMEARGEGLMRLDGVGRGLASGTRPRPSSFVANGDNLEAGAMGDFDGADYVPRLLEKKDTSPDPISDANLLKLARKLGSEWTRLAEHVGIPQEDLDTIIANEGTDYSGGFRMLWVWRDSLDTTEGSEANAKILGKGLHKAGFQEFADPFLR